MFKNKELIATLGLLSVALIWGSAFIAVEQAINAGWKTFPILMVRGFVGGLVLLPFALKTKFYKNKKLILSGLLLGSISFVAFYLQTYGQELSNVVNSAFLTTLYVVFAPLISLIMFKQRQNKKVIIGGVLSLIGVFFLTVLENGSFSLQLGDILLFFCAIFFALHIVLVGKNKMHNAIAITVVQLFTMGFLSLFFMQVTNQTTLSFNGLPSVLFAAVFSSAIATLVQVTSQKFVSSSRASILMAQETLVATVLTYIIAKSLPSIFIVIGGALMILSVLIIEVTIKRKVNLKKYNHLLIDIDDTLLDFHRSQEECIKKAYNYYSIKITHEMFEEFKKINSELWKKYERKEITVNYIYSNRFEMFNFKYGLHVSGFKIEAKFREYLNSSFHLIEGAKKFLKKAKKNYQLIIVTNGKKETQYNRLKLANIEHYFDHIFISEEVGYNKPDINFFLAIENKVSDFDKSKAIIIGDSTTSDILGGINYQIDTCLFDFKASIVSHNANYLVNSFKELKI